MHLLPCVSFERGVQQGTPSTLWPSGQLFQFNKTTHVFGHLVIRTNHNTTATKCGTSNQRSVDTPRVADRDARHSMPVKSTALVSWFSHGHLRRLRGPVSPHA